MPFSKYSPKQKKLARVAPPRDKITGADLKTLAKNKKKAEKEIKSTSKKYRKGKLTKAEMNKIVKMRLKNYKNA